MGIPRGKIPWAPQIDVNACTGCGECREVCPNGVYELDGAAGKMKVLRPEQCVVLCDKCASFCPNEAIRFPDKRKTKDLLAQLIKERRRSV